MDYLSAAELADRGPGLRLPAPANDPKPDPKDAHNHCTLCGVRYAPHGACGYCRGRYRSLVAADRDAWLARRGG